MASICPLKQTGSKIHEDRPALTLLLSRFPPSPGSRRDVFVILFSSLCLAVRFSRISLNTLTLNVRSDKVYTRHGVPISVTGIAQVSVPMTDR